MSGTTETSWIRWVREGCIIVLIPLPLALLGFFSGLVGSERGPSYSLGLILVVSLLAAVVAALLVGRRDRAGNIAAALVVVGAAVLLVVAPYSVEKLYQKRASSPPVVCLSHLKQVAMAWLMYAEDHDGQFPPAEHWPQSLQPYLVESGVLLCPADVRPQQQKSDELATSYTMSDAFGCIHKEAIKEAGQAGVFFDGTKLHGKHEAAGFRHGELGLLGRERGAKGANVAYADGHCKYLRQEDFMTLRLEP